MRPLSLGANIYAKKKYTNSDIDLRSLSVRPLTNVFIIPFFI